MKATQGYTTCKNVVNRAFKTGIPDNVRLTDIKMLKDYIEYYNNYRYQWNLKKMTPVQYQNHLFEFIA